MAEKATRVAVVTGGNRGIGLEICRQLARRAEGHNFGCSEYDGGLCWSERVL